jgi:hypothetical protein
MLSINNHEAYCSSIKNYQAFKFREYMGKEDNSKVASLIRISYSRAKLSHESG